jgi:hypothetical protein
MGPVARLRGRPRPQLTNLTVDLVADVAFDCPRCRTAVQERFYGPCAACRVALGGLGSIPGSEVAPARFEPKMHVTPNHVATKE